ncbi:hypothetical protein PCASD_17054 [Puccinia coronata f. sp. avenae]|uniref:Uncharacterized protein n=1 Tax=Puccinia coronata f. sp. avenae TaxID=200324 RepID=A0A2N5SME0_9BASI|nr:hypothetical protein PCASD_17054 [Puccinia coronata f. sp. avenae]
MDSTTSGSTSTNQARGQSRKDSDNTSFACRWCPKSVKCNNGSYWTLKSHQDGANLKDSKRAACTGRSKSIEAGCHLPPTAAEKVAIDAQAKPAGSGTLIAYKMKGLKALKLSKSIVWPEKVDKYFPVLEATNEEPEDIEEVDKEESDNNEIDPDDAELESLQPGWEAPDAWANEDDDQCDPAGIGFTLKKKQSEWKLWAKKLVYEGRGVIGGYGIRWNLAYDSQQRAYEGRRVIKQLLDNKSDKFAGKSHKDHFFKSYKLSTKEWGDVNSLNCVLKDFLEMTKRMEGDGPKLGMVLYEYD